MIDFIKINNLEIGSERITKLLDFEIKSIEQTGEVLTLKKKSAHIDNLIFTITPEERIEKETGEKKKCHQIVKVQGSLHKYANYGEWNNDRFTFERFLKVADDLKGYISPNGLINTLEFGVNIQTPFDPTIFITNLISHRKKQINKTINSGIALAQAEYRQFILKIYNKGLQQGPKGSFILRVELKYLKMQKLFPSGLKWGDLKNIETWFYMGEKIQNKFNEIIYYDPSIELKSVPEKDYKIIEKGHNPIFWEKLSGPHVSRVRKNYQCLIAKYGNMFNNIPELLDQEIKELVKSYHFSNTAIEQEISKGFNKVVNCYPLLHGNFSPSMLETSIFNQSDNQIKRALEKVINKYYGCYFRDPLLITDYYKTMMIDDIEKDYNLNLAGNDFFEKLKEIYPLGLDTPF